MTIKKKTKTLDELLKEALVPEVEQPYKLPKGWIWVNVDSVMTFVGGGTPSKSNLAYWNGDIPWATVKDIKGKYLNNTMDSITNEGLENSSANVAYPSELLLITRMSPGKTIITNIKTAINQDLKIVRSKLSVLPEYMWLYFENNRGKIEHDSTGTTVKGIQVDKLKKYFFPLPPLHEQKRIVEKVKRLLSKVEEAMQLIEEAKETFEVRRASILDKAFRGELSAQWREDNLVVEDAFSILERIRTKKINSFIKSNTLKINSVTKDDEPFDLPDGWAWVRLGEISYYVTSGSRDWSKYYSNEGAMFVRTQDINKNSLNLNDVAFVSLPEKVEGKRSLVEKSDILTTITGANVGKCALVEADIKEAYVSQSVALTKLIEKSIAKYVHLSLLSPCGGGKELERRAYGIGRPVLSLEDIKNIKIPLAPIGEQQFIVDMVEKLLANEKESLRLASVEKQLEILKQSILNKAICGELGTNDLNEESSLGVLKEILQEKNK